MRLANFMTKTALDLTPQEWKAYRPAEVIQHRQAEAKSRLVKRKEQAWQLAHQAAQLLKNQFKAEKVAVFGSLTHEDWFNDWSDIDLAAWGIPAVRFYSAVAAITGLSADFKIDLVDPETCRTSIRAAIERYGIEL
jgi:uncharacterized protein